MGKVIPLRFTEPLLNEELVGEAIAPFKGKVVIATKFGWEPTPKMVASGAR